VVTFFKGFEKQAVSKKLIAAAIAKRIGEAPETIEKILKASKDIKREIKKLNNLYPKKYFK
jgi:hypothetical protein